MRSERWVHKWLKRFDIGDLDGLRDLPRTGRPPKIPRYIMTRIIERFVQPKCIPRELQKVIREEAGTRLHITNVRKIMHRYGLTPKVPQRAHINRASRDAVRSWQYRFDRRVSCLEEKGFTILDMDEAFCVYDVASGCKYWLWGSGSSYHTPETPGESWSMALSPRTAGSSSGRASCSTRQPSSGM